MIGEIKFKLGRRDARAVLTFNRKDFKRLHHQSTEHGGIVNCTRDDDFISLAVRVDDALKDQATLEGLLIRIIRSQ